MTDPITSVPDAVAALGALPVPVGNQPQPLDDTRLAEITARAEAAHPGPWRRSDDSGSLERYVLSEDDLFAISFGYRGNNTQAEAEFVAHARDDVPALLAEVQRLKAELARRDRNVDLLKRQLQQSEHARERHFHQLTALGRILIERGATRHDVNQWIEAAATPATDRAEEA